MRDPNESIDIPQGPGEKEGEKTVLEIRVYYSKGGLSCMNYKQEPRGYYLLVQPVNVGEHFRTYKITPGSNKGGFKECIEPCKRLNRRRLDQLRAAIFNNINRTLVGICWDAGSLQLIYDHIIGLTHDKESA